MLTFVIYAHAEDCIVQKYEFEVNGGLSTPLGGWRGGKAQNGAGIGVAVRINTNLDLPISFGALIQLDCAHRDFFDHPDYSHDQNNRTLTLGALAEYDFDRCGKVNPFVSLAAGAARHDVVGYKEYWVSSDWSGVIMPRVGVELWHIVRLNCHAQFSRKGFNTLGFGLGLVLGGRPKRMS